MAQQSDINENINYPKIGLNTDGIIDQVQKGYVTDALNAVVENFDGQSINYQNETGAVFCNITLQNYKIIGVRNITELSQVLYFLVNPITGNSMIGYVLNNNCQFQILLDDTISGSDLMNFDVNHPIQKVEVKTNNCSTQFYFTDDLNPRRYVDLNNLPWLDGVVGQIDTNKMLVQPVFSVPEITVESVQIGGNLVEGCYQFALCYSDINSNQLTGFYSVTNPARVFLDFHISPNYNEVTNKSINISISNLDTTGLYSYFNLAVIRTINGTLASVDLVGTYNIQTSNFTFTYTGSEQSNANIKLSITDIMEKFDYYDIAGTLCQVDNQIVWGELIHEEDLSYQKIYNQVKVGWGTWSVPVTQFEGYTNGANCANLEGYFRDEVVPLEICLVLDNGKETSRGHLPGRLGTSFDLEIIPVTNPDIETSTINPCTTPVAQPRWKVYNTGSISYTDPGYIAGDTCYKGPFQYGEMSYWESESKYPNKPEVWGTLANTPIRHHKFPDSTITHIHDQGGNNIFPIGFNLDILSLYNAIQSSPDLSPAQKRQVVGFKIMRGDRIGNASVVARGLLNNCGVYTKDSTTYFYPNYPFNDLHPDPFISSTFVADKSGSNTQNLLNDFQKGRFTFHSPDTHFYQASSIQGSFLKLETAEYGECKSHFVQVLDNAGEKLRTKYALEIAFVTGVMASIGMTFDYSTSTSTEVGDVDAVTTTTSISLLPTLHPENFFPTYNATLDILDKTTNFYNYGWQYNGLGFYSNYFPIADNGNKQRYIQYGGYITSGTNGTFGDNSVATIINNTNRESSVFLSLGGTPETPGVGLPFVQDNSVGVPADNSRVTMGTLGFPQPASTPFNRNIASYYATIKRYLPDQYGEIFSYTPVDTGYYSFFFNTDDTQITSIPIIFGGDCFINKFALKIKHPFYLKNSVNLVDGADIDYNQDQVSNTETGNVGYPIWYYSTDNTTIDGSAFQPGLTNLINTFNTPGGIAVLILTGGLSLVAIMLQLLSELFSTVLFSNLGLKITNLDENNYASLDLFERGVSYLYAYGVINFFVESQINVEMRQAYNEKEGNYYPLVSTDIPDNWLQQTNVPIAFDNTYTYNKTFSKENKETFFALLRPDWEPNQTCYINYNNRVIWSDKSDLEETKNNWLVYRPANLFDFPKGFGKVNAMDALENRQVLIRYDNRSQIYNALSTVGTSGLTASLGTGALFSGSQPLDLSNTDNGSFGSQHKFILNTENGHIFVDAKRGQVILLRGTNVEELSSPKYLNSMWFTNNLPFNILKQFPTVDVDNNYNGLGLHGVYDSLYHRFILTKLDYEPISNNLTFDGTNFFYTNPYTQKTTQVQLTDPTYFCNKSWTISFSFVTNTWISKHSYQPNFYIEYEDYFQIGVNNGLFSNVWDMNSTFTVFNNYFGTTFPYILEIPYAYKAKDELFQSLSDYTEVLKYSTNNQYTAIKETVYFNKVTCYNNQQCTGELDIVAKNNLSLYQYSQYPIYNPTSTSILVTKSAHFFNMNMFWDIVKDTDQPIFIDTCGTTTGDKVLNNLNLAYGNQSYKKYPLMAKECRVRLSMNHRSDLKFITHFIISQTQNVYK